jgi:hypothetical protein
MATRPPQSLASDFSDVLAYLKELGLVPRAPGASLFDSARKIHRATYSLILWRFRLTGLPQHSRVFIEEIASDALQVLPQTLMGYNKATKFLIRGIVENVLRHVYFHDHPIEFGRMNRDAKWYLTMEKLFEYPLIHPLFIATEPRFDAINRLSSLYSELSAGVHGRKVKDLEMRRALNRIAYSEPETRRVTDLIERCAEAANFMLAMFHRGQLMYFQSDDRRIILRTIPPRARAIWREHE